MTIINYANNNFQLYFRNSINVTIKKACINLCIYKLKIKNNCKFFTIYVTKCVKHMT